MEATYSDDGETILFCQENNTIASISVKELETFVEAEQLNYCLCGRTFYDPADDSVDEETWIEKKYNADAYVEIFFEEVAQAYYDVHLKKLLS